MLIVDVPRREAFRAPVLLPLLAALSLQLLISALQLDKALADLLYTLEGGRWLFKDHWFFADLLHTGGRRFSILLLLLVLALLVASFFVAWLKPYKRVLGYLTLAPLCATLLVSSLKQATGIDCPWDLAPYGGDLPYVPLLSALMNDAGEGACFPAGHASAGYAWVAVYFAAALVCPRWKWRLLGIAMTLGLVFGVCQQLRGAHFLSHDLWSLTLCWCTAAVIARLMLVKQRSLVTPRMNNLSGLSFVEADKNPGGRR